MSSFKDFHLQRLAESKHVDEIRLDPERDDSFDVVDKLMPFLIKQAYYYLNDKRNKHERVHGDPSDDEDAYNFDFSEDALRDELDDVITHLKNRFADLSTIRMQEYIDHVKGSFSVPLRGK